jgi:hypothetical protein
MCMRWAAIRGKRAAAPGGRVAGLDADPAHAAMAAQIRRTRAERMRYPPHPAFDRLRDIFSVVFRSNGVDPWTGRRVPELFRRAGLEQEKAQAMVQMYPPGNSQRTRRLGSAWPGPRARCSPGARS